MKAAQFVKGKIDGIQKVYFSRELNYILPREKIAELSGYTDTGEYPRFFKAEKVLAKTVVTAADNSDGRRGGIVNHTVLYQFAQTVTQDTIEYQFPLDEFITEILAGKRRFKMPPFPSLPEDNVCLDPPPPIEWEAQP